MGSGKVPQVVLVGLGRGAGELVGTGIAGVADEFLEIVVVLREAPGQLIQKLGIRGWVGDPDVVDRLDDSLAEEMGPHDIGQVAGEERILGGGQPVGKGDPSVVAPLELRRVPAEELGWHGLLVDGVVDLPAPAVVDDGLPGVGGPLAADLAEEGGERVVVVLGPLVEGMVVALGALDAHPHEYLGHVLGDLEVVALHLVIIGGGVDESTAGGGEQLADDPVHGHVVGDPVLEPVEVEEGGLVAHALVVVGLDLQKLGELHDPHLGEFLALQQAVHELGPLVGGLIRHKERRRFPGRVGLPLCRARPCGRTPRRSRFPRALCGACEACRARGRRCSCWRGRRAFGI